jgi:hypothetical protein
MLRIYHDSMDAIKVRNALLDAWTDTCVIVICINVFLLCLLLHACTHDVLG